MSRSPLSRLPVTLLGGYLGAGKTTLVNHLLRHSDGRRIAVMVNDFGALAIDADLIVGDAQGSVLSLAGGCVCCSYGDDLLAALIDLAKLDPRPDHVLIETSGVALPGAVARSLSLLLDVALDAIVVMADASTTEDRLVDAYLSDTLGRQFADADLIVLNKCDLLSPADVDQLARRLQIDYPRARLLRTEHATLPRDVVLGIGARLTLRQSVGGSAHQLSLHDHMSVTFDGRIDTDMLASELMSLDLVRAKGFAQSLDGAWMTIQLAGRRSSVEPAPAHIGGEGRLVCIAVGHAVDREAVLSVLRRAGARL